jgi:hypothetical protein
MVAIPGGANTGWDGSHTPEPQPTRKEIAMTIEQLAQEILDLRDEDRDALEGATAVETEAFAAFASEYLAMVRPCTNCHIP